MMVQDENTSAVPMVEPLATSNPILGPADIPPGPEPAAQPAEEPGVEFREVHSITAVTRSGAVEMQVRDDGSIAANPLPSIPLEKDGYGGYSTAELLLAARIAEVRDRGRPSVLEAITNALQRALT